MIPLLQVATCENIGNSITNSFTCIGDYIFWQDSNMLVLFFVVMLAYVGMVMKVPASTMFTFAWPLLFVVYWTFNAVVLVPIIVLGIIFTAIQIVNAFYKGPKDATQ